MEKFGVRKKNESFNKNWEKIMNRHGAKFTTIRRRITRSHNLG
jgi:hypothetical protein